MQKVIPEDSVLVPDSAERVFKGQIFDVYQWPQTMYDGSSHTFEMLKRPDTVTAICVVEDKILVIDDEQPYTGSRKSFPGGRVDSKDISIEAATQREVREETGYTFQNWRLVKVWQPYRKMEWFIYVLLAWDVSGRTDPVLDSGERITVEELDLDTVKGLVMRKAGYLGESTSIFKDIQNLNQLLAISQFRGQTVDR